MSPLTHPPEKDMTFTCHVCGSDRVELIKGYSELGRITSDCQPFPRPGQLTFCRNGGTAQVPINSVWLSDIDQIYKEYSIYSQGGGAEQVVFETGSGASIARSDRLVERLLSTLQLSPSGRLLDIGCGNGAFLRAFRRRITGWTLMGTEVNDRYRAEVEIIPGATLHLGELPVDSGRFQLVSMIHVLEHIPYPGEFLERVWHTLDESGVLFVQVPDYVSNPFELMIADHATHLCFSSAQRLVCRLNFELITATTDWVSKEISIVAHKVTARRPIDIEESSAEKLALLESRVRWLGAIVSQVRRLAGNGAIGLFGTSIAASWVFGHCQQDISFFVDEDRNRAGKMHFGRPVYHPVDAPRDCPVLVALAPEVARSVVTRLGRTAMQWVMPQEIGLYNSGNA